MVWIVPHEAWWETDGHYEEIRRPSPPNRRAIAWDALDEEELEPEDEGVVAFLTSRGGDDDEPSEPRFDCVDCWTARLLCDGRETLAVEHLLFAAREDLVGFIRWLTVNLKENVRQEEGNLPAEPKSSEEWDSRFGHVAWSFPDNPADWVLHRTLGSDSQRIYGWASLYGAGTHVLGSIALRAEEVDDFLVWLKDSLGTFTIDPPSLGRA